MEVAGIATPGGTVTVNGSTASRQGGRFRSEWSVAGTAAAWQNVDVSLSAGEVVPDRKLYLPPQSESYSHDLDGNMTGDGRWTYTWDGENQLVSASTTSGAYTAGVPGRKVDYTYDWMGRMIRRVGYSGNPITPSWTQTDDTRFAYDGWLCRWESMTNSSAASKPWVSAVKPSSTVRSDYAGWVGMRILTGESPVWVTRLGRWVLSGNSGSHTVKLVLASNGTDVSGGSVSVNTSGASTNRFLYADLASPIQLAANTAYYLVSLETNGGDKWYQNDTVVNPGPGLTVTHAAHGSGGSYWTSASPNNSYGPVSLVGVPTTESRTQLWGLDLSGSEQGAGGVGGLLGTRTGAAATRFMAYDGNGNIVGTVNGGTGKTAATTVYSPFGELIAREGDAERDRYGFSTKWGDGDTGSLYYGFRFLAVKAGRWLNADLAGERGGVNMHSFGRNDCLNHVDPSGLTIISTVRWMPWEEIGPSANLPQGERPYGVTIAQEVSIPPLFTEAVRYVCPGGRCARFVSVLPFVQTINIYLPSTKPPDVSWSVYPLIIYHEMNRFHVYELGHMLILEPALQRIRNAELCCELGDPAAKLAQWGQKVLEEAKENFNAYVRAEQAWVGRDTHRSNIQRRGGKVLRVYRMHHPRLPGLTSDIDDPECD